MTIFNIKKSYDFNCTQIAVGGDSKKRVCFYIKMIIL